jgi:hypothetical protein
MKAQYDSRARRMPNETQTGETDWDRFTSRLPRFYRATTKLLAILLLIGGFGFGAWWVGKEVAPHQINNTDVVLPAGPKTEPTPTPTLGADKGGEISNRKGNEEGDETKKDRSTSALSGRSNPKEQVSALKLARRAKTAEIAFAVKGTAADSPVPARLGVACNWRSARLGFQQCISRARGNLLC